MVFVSDNNSDDEEQKNPSQGPVAIGTTGGTRLAPSSGVGGGGGTGTNSSVPAKPGAGGAFASLDKYVTANQGNADPIANNVISGANTQYQGLDQGNTSALNNVSQQVKSGYTPADNALIAKEQADPIAFSGGNNNPGALQANPIVQEKTFGNLTSNAVTPDDSAKNIASFQKQLNDTYTGPASAESDTGVQAQQAKDNAAIANGQTLTSSDAGRNQLIQQNSREGNNAGVTALNSAVVSEDPNALNKVQHAYDPFSNLVTNLNTGTANIDTSIGAAQTEAQKAAQDAQNALNGQYGALNTQIQGENTTAFNKANTDYQNLVSSFNNAGGVDQALLDAVNKAHAQGAVAGGDAGANAALTAALAQKQGTGAFTPDQLAQLGVTPDQMNQLLSAEKNLETSKFVSSGNGGNGSAWTTATEAPLAQWLSAAAPTQENFTGATAQDIATGNALNTIGGQNVFSAPSSGPAYVAPTFDINGALSALNSGVTQNNFNTQQQADAVAASQQAAHDASKGGLFKSLVNSPLLKTGAEYLANPLLVVPKMLPAVPATK